MGRKCASVSCRCHCHQTTTTRSSLRHFPQPQTRVRVQVRVRVRVRFPVESFPHCRRQSGSSSRKAKKNDYGTLCKWAGKLQLTCLLAGNQKGMTRKTITTTTIATQNRMIISDLKFMTRPRNMYSKHSKCIWVIYFHSISSHRHIENIDCIILAYLW